jgi:hypothetical protein
MKLTGKCKEDFMKWYGGEVDKLNKSKGYYYDIDYFTNSMQYGVYVDFFNSEEIYISIINDFEFIDILINRDKFDVPTQKYTEAITIAIEEANEIYNKI